MQLPCFDFIQMKQELKRQRTLANGERPRAGENIGIGKRTKRKSHGANLLRAIANTRGRSAHEDISNVSYVVNGKVRRAEKSYGASRRAPKLTAASAMASPVSNPPWPG